jgi:hypothetical protein
VTTQGGNARAQLEERLEGALLWGIELEPRYRVLAATLELGPTQRADGDGGNADGRVLLVAHPVATILASVRELDRDPPVVRRFDVDQLPDVAAALGGGRLEGPIVGRPEPRRDAWGPGFGLEGRSSAADGTRTTVTLATAIDGLRLDLFVRCDVVELRTAEGSLLLRGE